MNDEIFKIDQRDILREVCRYFDLSPRDIFRNDRRQELVQIRSIFFYLVKKHSKMTYLNIGKIAKAHGRVKPFTHATVLFLINKLKDERIMDKDLNFNIQFIERQAEQHKIILDYEDRLNYKFLLERLEEAELKIEKLESKLSKLTVCI